MDNANTANSDEINSFSLQAQIIRQMQTNDGQTACYATSASNQCENKECGWRHDCFDESRERG